MIPHIAKRGHSFIGIAKYMMHDKDKATTSNHVTWTQTLNLPTQNPETAFKCMVFTAQYAHILKQKAGIAAKGTVYSFSLSWHPKQNPNKEIMLLAAQEALEHLNLHEHEAVIVAHNDTDHPHVHIICNLVHPKTGKIYAPSYDRLTLSKWAEEIENMDGEILCAQRVINNASRRNNARTNRQLSFVKYREKQLDSAEEIQQLYNQFGSGKAFQTALKARGYILAKGDRRGFVLVDENGKVHSLSRQLKGQRAKDIKARLQDTIKSLPNLSEAKAVYQIAIGSQNKNEAQRFCSVGAISRPVFELNSLC